MREKIKGKYARKEGKGSNGKQKECRNAESSDSEHEWDFPVLTSVDKERHLHCYSAVLSRSENEPVTMEELDRLQPELELMLSAAAIRLRTLRTLVEDLSHPSTTLDDSKTSSQRKRKFGGNRVPKSTKDLSKVREREREPPSKMDVSSSENETDNSRDIPLTPQPTMAPVPGLAAQEAQKGPELPKNDTPNRFWASIEPYAGDITPENIKDLEELIACCDADMVGAKIPPLGRHYTEKWADMDLSAERSSSAVHNSNKLTSGSSDSDSNLLKKASNYCDRTPGPLLQRLVSALMEEPSRDSFQSKLGEENDSIYLSKIPLYHTTACFERRIRRELEEAGLFDSENDEDGDEILAEIKKCVEELQKVAELNKGHLTRLLTQAKNEMVRQHTKNKIKVIDAEIIEMQRKTAAAKLKNKQLQKKKREQAWKLLKDREALLNSL